MRSFPGNQDNVLNEGVVSFYSAQAESMLTQYENINHLLGPTKDWTHPGTLCEELLRHFLRQTLPPRMAVDKGYFFGRTEIDGTQTHSPEIDILIHDRQRYQTVFRMGDFVIVQPKAVIGIIQVKRALTPGQLWKGLSNVVRAKQQLVTLLSQPGSHPVMPRVFSGVVAFADRLGDHLPKYQTKLYDCYKKYRDADSLYKTPISLFVMPDFIASLSNLFCLDIRAPEENVRYAVYKSQTQDEPRRNLALQAFLFAIARTDPDSATWPPLAFPLEMPSIGTFAVLETVEQLAEHQHRKG